MECICHGRENYTDFQNQNWMKNAVKRRCWYFCRWQSLMEIKVSIVDLKVLATMNGRT